MSLCDGDLAEHKVFLTLIILDCGQIVGQKSVDRRVIPCPTIDATAVDMKLIWSVVITTPSPKGILRTVNPPAFVGCVGPVTKTLAYVQLEWRSIFCAVEECVDVVDARACLNSEGNPCVRERELLCNEGIL